MTRVASEMAESLQGAIVRRAAEFDLPALIALLDEHFPELGVVFESHASRALEPTLVHAVQFGPESVTVVLNLGLFSATTPLPAYFDSLLQHPRAGPALEAVLGAVNDRLLASRAVALGPVASAGAPERLSSMRRCMLELARPASPIGLSWLLQRVFPEMSVSVRRVYLRRSLSAPALLLGTSTLGVAAVGGEAALVTPGIEAQLTTAEATTWTSEPWAAEARRRLAEYVLPSMSHLAAMLRVLLVIRDDQSRIVIHDRGQLGFDPLGSARGSSRVRLFEGAAR